MRVLVGLTVMVMFWWRGIDHVLGPLLLNVLFGEAIIGLLYPLLFWFLFALELLAVFAVVVVKNDVFNLLGVLCFLACFSFFFLVLVCSCS